MSRRDKQPMGSFSFHITNASLLLVNAVEDQFSQSENNAAIEIGVCIGMVLSACILLFIYGFKRCRRQKKLIKESGPASDVSIESNADRCENKDDEDCEDCEKAPYAVRTEGAYRSDSDSDDDGQGARVNKEAQKRSRKAYV